MTRKRRNRRQLPSVSQDVIPVDLLAMVEEEMHREITVSQGGVRQQKKAQTVLFQKILQTAIGGSPHSQRLAMDLMAEASSMTQQQRLAEVERGRQYRAVQQEKLNNANAEGRDIRLILPHPDDIVIDEQKGVSYPGPINEEELRKIEASIRLRDTLLLQDAVDQRLLDPDPNESFVTSSAMILAHLLNGYLPARFQLTKLSMMGKCYDLEKHTKRDLLKLAYQAWRRTGHPQPRGYTSPRYVDVAKNIEFAVGMINRLSHARESQINVDNRQLQEWVTAEREMLDG